MKASILDLRYHMKDVLKAIDRGETVTVTCRGKERARILPMEKKTEKPKKPTETAFYGLWKYREDMADPDAWVRKMREPRFRDL